MMRMLLTALGMTIAATAAGGEAPGILIVTADLDSALVVIDSGAVLPVPLQLAVEPGSHLVRVRPGASESWLVAGTTDTVTVAAGDTTRFAARLRVRHRLMPEPADSPVYVGDSLAGFTPRSLRAAGAGSADDDRVVSVRQEASRLRLPLVITGGTALVSGVAAAAWKVRADELYAEYRQTRNPALRERTRRLDTSAAIALVAMQVSLGLFVHFLLSDVP